MDKGDNTYSYKQVVNSDRLKQEILTETSIAATLTNIEVIESEMTTLVSFSSRLSYEELILLDSIMKSHLEVLTSPSNVRLGWKYQIVSLEVTTGKLNSLHSSRSDGTANDWVSATYYNESDVEVTNVLNESTITKTVIDIEPPFNYEFNGGAIQLDTKPSALETCRLWLIALPDIDSSLGGSFEMSGSLNLRYLPNEFRVDHKFPIKLNYDPELHTNKIRFMLKHDAGLQISLQILLDVFRP